MQSFNLSTIPTNYNHVEGEVVGPLQCLTQVGYATPQTQMNCTRNQVRSQKTFIGGSKQQPSLNV